MKIGADQAPVVSMGDHFHVVGIDDKDVQVVARQFLVQLIEACNRFARLLLQVL
ncbi:hypothetical protein D9M71_822780 [compost metagenome]